MPPVTARLLSAVAAEREELSRHRARLAEEAEELRAALAHIESGLAEIDERRGLLDRLAREGEAVRGAAPGRERRGRAVQQRAAVAVEPARAGAGELLRGPAIREAAVQLLARRGGGALHYRDWFDLVTAHGYIVAGKDPLAVFLTQLGRSPAVRRGERAGVYELDRHADRRLKAQLEELQRELRALTLAPAGGRRADRARLTAEIDRTERALEELARALA